MLNKVILMGRLTKEPELRQTPSGVAVCSFSIAIARSFVKSGEERQVDFINCVAWRNMAEFVSKYFDKGRMINVVGSIQIRSWEDGDGTRRYATDVIVSEVNFCGDKKRNSDSDAAAPKDEFVSVPDDEDFPF